MTTGEQASDRIDRLTDALLADSLAHEETAFAMLYEAWTRPTDAVRDLVVGSLDRRPSAVADAVVDRVKPVVRSVESVIVAVCRTNVGLALDSVRQELREIEDFAFGTWDNAFAAQAVAAADKATDGLVDVIVEAWRDADEPAVLTRLRDDVRTQMQARGPDEDPDRTADRIVRDVPVNLPGRSGRGVWWAALTSCQAIVRARSVGAMNVARERAMAEYNALVGG